MRRYSKNLDNSQEFLSQSGTSTSSSSQTAATPSPPPSQLPTFEPQGRVPRDIGAAAGAPFSLLVWDLREGGRLWRREYEGAWQEYMDRQFLVAPVVVTTSETTQTAFSVDAVSGHVVFMYFDNGHWDHGNWHELEMECCTRFLVRPAVVSRAERKIDVVNVDSEGKVLVVSYDGSLWSEWTELGTGFTGEMSATSWSEERIDVFGTSGNAVLHMYWESDSGWAEEWEDLGEAFSGSYRGDEGKSSPLAVSWRTPEGDNVIDVIVNGGSTMHRLFSNGAWGDWNIFYASHEGVEYPDTQSLVSGDGVDGRPFAHIISRGTDDCVHYNAFNGTSWGSWKYMWCAERTPGEGYVTKFMPTIIVSGADGAVEVVARDKIGRLIRYEIHGTMQDGEMLSNEDWEELGNGG